jgi:hypothetical protein
VQITFSSIEGCDHENPLHQSNSQSHLRLNRRFNLFLQPFLPGIRLGTASSYTIAAGKEEGLISENPQ